MEKYAIIFVNSYGLQYAYIVILIREYLMHITRACMHKFHGVPLDYLQSYS
jgi:hypothetical protein